LVAAAAVPEYVRRRDPRSMQRTYVPRTTTTTTTTHRRGGGRPWKRRDKIREMSAHYKAEAREPAGAGTGIGSGPAALFPTGVHQRRMSGPHAAGRAATNLTVLRRAFSWGGLSPPAGHRVPSPPLLRRHHHSSPHGSPRPRARKSEQSPTLS